MKFVTLGADLLKQHIDRVHFAVLKNKPLFNVFTPTALTIKTASPVRKSISTTTPQLKTTPARIARKQSQPTLLSFAQISAALQNYSDVEIYNYLENENKLLNPVLDIIILKSAQDQNFMRKFERIIKEGTGRLTQSSEILSSDTEIQMQNLRTLNQRLLAQIKNLQFEVAKLKKASPSKRTDSSNAVSENALKAYKS